MLKIEEVNAGYGKFHILFDVSTRIDDKKLTVVIGPNGSGKSTFLKTICGLTTIYSGRIIYEQEDITRLPPHQIVRRGIAYLPQLGNVFLSLSVKENLLLSSYTLDRSEAKERIDEVLDYFPVLKERYNKKAITLSGGERQMLAIAMALVRRPKIMLFDEPTANLSPKLALEVLNKIVRLRDDYGVTIVVVEQNARKALEYGDRALLFVGGRINFDGEPDELLKHPELSSLYLGAQGPKL